MEIFSIYLSQVLKTALLENGLLTKFTFLSLTDNFDTIDSGTSVSATARDPDKMAKVVNVDITAALKYHQIYELPKARMAKPIPSTLFESVYTKLTEILDGTCHGTY